MNLGELEGQRFQQSELEGQAGKSTETTLDLRKTVSQKFKRDFGDSPQRFAPLLYL